MAFRLRLVPADTRIDFYGRAHLGLIGSSVAVVAAILLVALMGLNFGIDFRGGTTIRTISPDTVETGAYRSAIEALELGEVTVTEVFDPTFGPDENVAQIRIQAQAGAESVTSDTMDEVRAALTRVDPELSIEAIESVGPKVSGELIRSAAIAVLTAAAAIMVYIWLRFEWQFALGAVAALVHDVTLTLGLFALLQLRFDLSIIAALLTILGYSINDTVVIFDRVRENLRKYKKMVLTDLMNLSINETLARTVMTSGTTLLALITMLILGGDVIRGFVFAMTWGVIVGTYSSVFVAGEVLRMLGVKRDWSKEGEAGKAGTQFTAPDG